MVQHMYHLQDYSHSFQLAFRKMSGFQCRSMIRFRVHKTTLVIVTGVTIAISYTYFCTIYQILVDCFHCIVFLYYIQQI